MLFQYSIDREKEYQSILQGLDFGEERNAMIRDRAHYLDKYYSDSVIEYDENLVEKVYDLIKNSTGNVTITMTTCKRFNLFTQTVSSFINCCLDIELVSRWICVDDNSTEEDRKEMKELYPFIEYVFKTPDQKGHGISMNIIKSMVTTPYVFHIEDDWLFFDKKNIIGPAIEILEATKYNCEYLSDKTIGQIMLNESYHQITAQELNSFGADATRALSINAETKDGTKFIVHAYNLPRKFIKKYSYKAHNWQNNWPHFSLQPSIIKTQVFKDVGDFVNVGEFEKEYAFRYVALGYVTAFFEGMHCKHIGKLSWEKSSANAYKLNGIIKNTYELEDEITLTN